MLSVLIVDDETWVRRGIMEKAEWQKLGAAVVAEACNGFEGLEKARAFKPDIVITDMKMPVMDGVEFISHLHREFPEISIIIVSGYSDYEYTRQALLNKVTDYILKPIKKSELNNVLMKTIKEHLGNIKEKMDVSMLRKNLGSNMDIVRNKTLNSLIDGDNKGTELNAGEMEKSGILHDWKYSSLIIIMICNFRTISDEKFSGNDELLSGSIIEAIDRVNAKNHCISFKKNGFRHIFLLLCGESQERSVFYNKDKLDRIYKDTEAELYKSFNVEIKAGAGRWCQSFENLQVSYKEAVQALNSINIISIDNILHFADIDSSSEELSSEEYLNILIRFILAGDEVNTCKQIQRMAGDFIKRGGITFKELYKLRMKFINGLEQELTKSGFNSSNLLMDDTFEEIKDIWAYTSLDEVVKWFGIIASDVAVKIRSISDTSAKHTVNRAIEYINNHYNEKITLETISEKYYIGSTYFCKILKKEIGINFVDYLTEVRMKKARELFENYNKRVYEVAEMVGYKDVRHFSKLYKKYLSRNTSCS